MALIARVYRSDPDERRSAVRYPMGVGATLRASEGEPIDVLIYDLSLTGFRMETAAVLDLEEPVWIHDFVMVTADGAEIDIAELRDRFQDAYARIWTGELEDEDRKSVV